MAPPDRARWNDTALMGLALRLARRGLGRVWPNPAVGCVIVSPDNEGQGRIVGRGWTQPGGRPHAETVALAQAGSKARGATAYVTLEPCSHVGKTGPCADALVDAGIARVVAALEDPDPRVSGRGFEKLRAAGIAVAIGICADEARAVNAGFLSARQAGRPMVTLKLATTLDGKIATSTGKSRWITGPIARAEAHALRARHDGIVVGRGTVEIDDPSLTCRLPGMADRSPVRVVFDSALSLPLHAQLVRTARAVPTVILTAVDDLALHKPYKDSGVDLLIVERGPDGHIALTSALSVLKDYGLTRLLVEGGAGLAASFLKADVVDTLVWLRAATVFGGDGLSALSEIGMTDPADAPRFRLTDRRRLGPDVMETFTSADHAR